MFYILLLVAYRYIQINFVDWLFGDIYNILTGTEDIFAFGSRWRRPISGTLPPEKPCILKNMYS